MYRRLEVRKDGFGFCYQGSWIAITVNDEAVIIAEEVSYEVAVGSQFSKIRLIIKGGKVFVESPLGSSELADPSQIIDNIKKVNEESIKDKNKELYEKIKKHLKY
ncbi:hypothetical protein [Stygiolobus caldivivus]|uniref:Uncharacterized protein n=1 Tax=Stygiolobus caldivivus TaxID=2824673 RepID=A0A8D5U5Z2_9CREN|nr:hypothetical protein [Stygiolobus caldivivus]BCU69933.1 hypothetical protein KN1_12300 [Stygiolobus caldivivus]